MVNTAPPVEPEETDLGPAPELEPLPGETGKPPVDRPDAEYCGPTQRIYTPSSKGAQYHAGSVRRTRTTTGRRGSPALPSLPKSLARLVSASRPACPPALKS